MQFQFNANLNGTYLFSMTFKALNFALCVNILAALPLNRLKLDFTFQKLSWFFHPRFFSSLMAAAYSMSLYTTD